MNLTRHLLLRVRRSIRRQLMTADRSSLRAIEEWAGPRTPTPPNRMKPSRFILLAVLFVVAIGFLLSCVEASKKTTMPDGTKIEEYSKQTDPAVLRFGADVARAYSPREIRRVREEKSGRISPREIYQRSGAYGPFLP